MEIKEPGISAQEILKPRDDQFHTGVDHTPHEKRQPPGPFDGGMVNTY